MLPDSYNKKYTFDDVRTALEEKTLTHDLMMIRIKEAMANEESKPFEQWDLNLIRKFDRILYELENGKPYEGRRAEHRVKLIQALNRRAGRREQFAPIRRVILSAVAVFVLLFGAEVFLPYKWLSSKPTDDAQQYIIQGDSIDAGLTAQGNAADSTEVKRLRSGDIGEVIEFLGYEPSLPRQIPEGWSLRQYEAILMSGMKQFNASYQMNEEIKLLQYEEMVFDDLEVARVVLEQNKTGRYEHIGSRLVYFYENMDMSGCMWLEGLTFHSLTGPVSEDELTKLMSE